MTRLVDLIESSTYKLEYRVTPKGKWKKTSLSVKSPKALRSDEIFEYMKMFAGDEQVSPERIALRLVDSNGKEVWSKESDQEVNTKSMEDFDRVNKAHSAVSKHVKDSYVDRKSVPWEFRNLFTPEQWASRGKLKEEYLSDLILNEARASAVDRHNAAVDKWKKKGQPDKVVMDRDYMRQEPPGYKYDKERKLVKEETLTESTLKRTRDVSGTYRVGTIKTTYQYLVKVLGKPTEFEKDDADGKVQYQWGFNVPGIPGVIAIYDYRFLGDAKNAKVWSIGATRDIDLDALKEHFPDATIEEY